MKGDFHARLNIRLALALILFLCSTCAIVPYRPEKPSQMNYESVRDYVTARIRAEMARQGIQGLSIALVDDQRLVWAEGFGFADAEKEIPATPFTVYPVGSISKLFTATAVMQLHEQGRINIDDPLIKYLPDFYIKKRFPDSVPITLRHLLTHHSGLPSNYRKGLWARKPVSFTKITELIRNEYAAFPPGYIFNYSNVGMDLLGLVIQKASGRDFVSYTDQFLFRPMGMRYSSFRVHDGFVPFLSKGYRDGKEAEHFLFRDLPAGGLYSNVLDLGRFMSMIFAGGRVGENRILSQSTLKEMFTPQNEHVPLDLDLKIGLGWFLSDPEISRTIPVAHHGGELLLFFSQLMVVPEYKLGVVVIANSAEAKKAVDEIAREALLCALEAKTGVVRPESKKPAGPAEPKPHDGEAIRAFPGDYATRFGLMKISGQSGNLRLEASNTMFYLTPHAGGKFGIEYRLLGLIPIGLPLLDSVSISPARISGQEVILGHLLDQSFLLGGKIDPEPIPKAWQGRIGRYEGLNYDESMPVEDISLTERDGILVLSYRVPYLFSREIEVPVVPVSDKEAVVVELCCSMGDTISAVNINGEEILSSSGYLARKISQ